MRGRGWVRERGVLIVLPLAGTLFLLLMLVLPTSRSFLLPQTFVAFLISLAALCYITRAPRGHARRKALVVTVATTAAMATAVLGDPSPTPLAFLAWYPWVGGYAALVSRRAGPVAALTALVCAALVSALALHGDLTAMPVAYAAVLASIVASATVTYGFFSWGRGQAFADPLTGLTNRAGLMHAGDPAIAEALAAGGSQAVMVLDVNRFREINSALGHQAGDEALREYADLLRDVHPRPAFVGRLGGDEFVLVLSGHDQAGDRSDPNGDWLARLGERVLDQLDGPIHIRGINIELESTAGIASAPRDGDRLAKVLPCADAALANAKRDGARLGVWNAGMAGTVGVRSWELALHAELRNAITRGELVLYYQPVQEAATGRVVGAEALMRWRHPERGLLPPGSFLPMAERSSLIIGLTWWELEEAMAQCARWARAGLNLPVSANLSARMLVVDDLPARVARRLEHHGLRPEMLTLEITESALVSQPTRAAAMLGELRTAGVKLSLDDFGTGYSSMEILKALPFDEMKIDKSFVTDARGSLPDVAIVRSVVDLGHRLGLRVVGEGVEDEQSARMLTELGCDRLQGDVLSPPRPAGELEVLLARGVDVRRDRAAAAAVNARPPAAGGAPEPPGSTGGPGHPGNGGTAGGQGPMSAAWDAARQARADRVRADAARAGAPPAGTGPTGAPPAGAGLADLARVDAGRVEEARAASARLAALTSASAAPSSNGHGAAAEAAEPAAPIPAVPVETLRSREREGVRPPKPPDEPGRLFAVRQYRIMDTDPEPEFDALVAIAAHLTDCGFGYLAFMGDDREWPKACHGVQGGELRAWVGPGSFIVGEGRYLEVQDCSRDPRFAHLARLEPRVLTFFAGAPLRTADGHVIGSLSVSDRVPRRLTTGQRTALDTLGRHVMHLLDARLQRLLLAEADAGLARLEEFWHRQDLPAAAGLCAEVVRTLTQADAVAVMMPELPGSTIFHAAGASVAEGVVPLTELGVRATGEDERAIRELASARGPVFIADAATHPMIPTEMVERLGIASALMVPLLGAGGVQGMINVRWSQHLSRLDPAVLSAVTLFCGQARFTLGKLQAARAGGAAPPGPDGRGPYDCEPEPPYPPEPGPARPAAGADGPGWRRSRTATGRR